MCARYTMAKVSPDVLAEEFDVREVPVLEPQFNIAPTEESAIVVSTTEGSRRLRVARFGLVPHWAKDAREGTRYLNARAETIAESRIYRGALQRYRCLVVADGFYEWRREGKLRIPYWFHLASAPVFAFAGLWSTWRDSEGHRIVSFTIVTRPAEGIVSELHDRMPVILAPDAYAAWLDRDLQDASAVVALLERHRGAELIAHEVSRRVNNVNSDGPDLIEPV
jgi:putative SOS response-associated peptidase YedK